MWFSEIERLASILATFTRPQFWHFSSSHVFGMVLGPGAIKLDAHLHFWGLPLEKKWMQNTEFYDEILRCAVIDTTWWILHASWAAILVIFHSSHFFTQKGHGKNVHWDFAEKLNVLHPLLAFQNAPFFPLCWPNVFLDPHFGFLGSPKALGESF